MIVVTVMAIMAIVAFGVGYVAAQEGGRFFLVWSTQGNGAGQMSSQDNTLRGLLGQTTMGRTTSDDFDLTLGFHTGARAGVEAFGEQVRSLAMTPLPTATLVPTETPTPVPTGTPTAVPPTSTPSPIPDTPTPSPIPTDTPIPTTTPTPTITPVPTSTLSPTPVVIVVTSEPVPTDTPLPPTEEPAPSPTPAIIIVVATPGPEEPTAVPEPLSGGGACSAPSNGSAPIEGGLLMLLAMPVVLWRFGLRS